MAEDRVKILAENIILLMKAQFTGLGSDNSDRRSNILAVIDSCIIR